MNRDQRLAEVVFAPVGTALRRETQVIERDGWYQTITPSTGSVSGNEVIWSRLAAADAERIVLETIAQYTALRCPFKWCTSPLTEPAGFGAILERHGFSSWPTRGMAIDPQRFTAPLPSDVTVEAVTDATFDEYFTALRIGWGPDFGERDPEAMRADHARGQASGRFHYFLARAAGQPVGTAAFVLKERSGYLIGGNVIPSHRGRGIYRALLAARLRGIAAAGRTLATTQAREATSAPILEGLGFETLYTAPIYKREI